MVGALGALVEDHQLYIARPFMISSTCKTEAAESHAKLLKLTIDACNDKSSLVRGSMYCLASDGESH